MRVLLAVVALLMIWLALTGRAAKVIAAFK